MRDNPAGAVCSFCKRPRAQTGQMVEGPATDLYICRDCSALVQNLFEIAVPNDSPDVRRTQISGGHVTRDALPASTGMSMRPRADERDATMSARFPFLGLLACALALIPTFAVLAAKILYTIGGRYRAAGKSLYVLAVAYGVAPGVLAALAAVLAIVWGGPNRRIAVVALALVALSLALLYL